MSAVIKTFSTPEGYYLFDRESNSIVNLTETEFIAFENIEKNKASKNDYNVLQAFQEKGFCVESRLKTIEHPEFQYLSEKLDSKVEQITLQVTQNCNLRCSYCTYSGNYNHQRKHSNQYMSLEIMNKSVDFIMDRSKSLERICIGFYGGEPLLGLDYIKECVKYTKENYDGKDVHYTMTTNGTLLKDDSIPYLIENNFSVFISLDGPKDMHDINRVYANGKGSFDDIMCNLKHIKDKYPDFFKRISFNTVIAPGNDLNCVKDFYEAEDVIADNYIMRALVNPYGLKDEITYDDNFYITNSYQDMKLLLSKLGLYDKNKLSKLFTGDFIRIEKFYKKLSGMKGLSEIAHPGGPCVPGVKRPFIDIHGNLYPCERVNEQSCVMQIGNVYTGFDLEKISSLINVGKVTENLCKECWNFVHCSLCAAASDGDTDLSAQLRLTHCMSSKYATEEKLRIICLLLENGYDFEGEMH